MTLKGLIKLGVAAITATLIYLLNIPIGMAVQYLLVWGELNLASLIVVFIVNCIIQVLSIVIPLRISIVKYGMKVKHLALSVPLIYLFFALYSVPSFYMFIYTGKFAFVLSTYPAMPSWKASIFITLQYGAVMLITTAITRRAMKRKNNSDQDESSE